MKKKLDYKWVIFALGVLTLFSTLGFCSSTRSLYLKPVTDALGIPRSNYAWGDVLRYITTAVLNIFFGLSVGVNVLAARYIGARDRKNLSASIHTAAAVGLYGGLVMAVIGILISRPVLKMMLTPEEILGNYEAATGRLIARTFLGRDPMETPAVLVRNHGPFTWGKDAAEAVYHARVLEEVALMARLTLELNPHATFPEELGEKHFMRKHGPEAYYGQEHPEADC